VNLSANKPNKTKKSNKTIPNPLVTNGTSDYLKFTDSGKEQAQETSDLLTSLQEQQNSEEGAQP
jgi:hypothetical protein